MGKSVEQAMIASQRKEVEQKVSNVVVGAMAIQVVDKRSFQEAAAYLKNIKGAIKFVDDAFDAPVKSAKKAWDDIRGLRDKAKEPLEKAESVVKGRMGSWTVAEEVKRKREEEAMQAAADAVAAEDGVAAPAVQLPSAVPDVEGVHTRKAWKFEITDAAAVGRAYLIPDEKKIRQIVNAMGEEAAGMVGGIRVWADTIIVARGE